MRRIYLTMVFMLVAATVSAAPVFQEYRITIREPQRAARLGRALLDRYAATDRPLTLDRSGSFAARLTSEEAASLRAQREVLTVELVPGSLPETAAPVLWKLGEYSYDGSGNIIAIANAGARTTNGTTTGGVTEQYVYDSVGRLRNATLRIAAGNDQSYEFDPYGNMTAKNGTAISVEATTNRLTGRSYDAQGNERGDATGSTVPVDQYAYDALNTLVTEKSANVTFLYTADDERIAIIQNPGPAETITWSVRDLTGKVVRDFTQTSAGTTPGTDYVYRGGLLAATIKGTDMRRYHLDHLGTPRLITDSNGVIKEFHHYYPYGEEATTTTSADVRMKFTGHERDLSLVSTGELLDYMHARYYSSGRSRFLTSDPVYGSASQPLTLNRYSYVRNRPTAFADPRGLAERPPEGCTETKDGRIACNGEIDTITHTRQNIEEAEWRQSNRELDRDLADWLSNFDGVRDTVHTLSYLRANDLYSNQVTLNGLEAFADGVVPDLPGCGTACDPFAYNGFYDVNDDGMRSAQVIGSATRDIEIAIAGVSLRSVSGGGTWLNKGRYLRVGESFTKGQTWFAVRGQWIDRLTGQPAKHIYLWILRYGR